MRTPYNLNVQQHCTDCTLRKAGWFCQGSPQLAASLDEVKFTTVYPKGSLLFVEGEAPRGVFILCSGKAKMTTSSAEGRTLIVGSVEPGQIVGASACVLNTPYELSVETTEPTQVNFITRDHFMQLLASHSEASMHAAQQLSTTLHKAQRDIRSFGLSQTTAERLAKLLLDWCAGEEETPSGVRLKVLLTHEEIAQMIGTTRETVTRILSDFRRRHIIDVKGSTFLVPQVASLADMVSV